MRVIHRTTDYESRGDRFTLIPIGDVHLGNRHCEERRLREMVYRIEREPETYWLGLGDMCEFINLHDPRWSADELPDWMLDRESLRDIARAEYRRLVDLLAPIRGKCLALAEGNHEASIMQHSEVDVYGAIIEGLADGGNAHRLDHRGFVDWRFLRCGGSTWHCRIHVTHGSGGGRSGGAVGNKLRDIVSQVDGVDVVLMGHLHRPEYVPISKVRIGSKGESVRATVHAISIPALCSDMRYADSKDMWTVPTGWCEIEIEPDERAIRVQTTVS